jgi:hypothetical protein
MKITELIMILLLTSCSNMHITISNKQQNEFVVCKDYGNTMDCIVSDKRSAEYEIQRVLDRY